MMQGAAAGPSQPSLAIGVCHNSSASTRRDSDDDDSAKTPVRSNSTHGGTNPAMAYPDADGGMLGHATNRVRMIAMSVGAFFDNLFGEGSSNGEGNANGVGGDDDDDKHRAVPCYCLPFISLGRGERGRSNVRAISALFFPLFLLSFFLLDDIGHTMMRNIRLRNGAWLLRFGKGKNMNAGMVHPVLRRKTLHEYPGIKRELMWVPLEYTMNLDDRGTSAKASMKCPKGILFLFHGCGRYAASFFYSPQGRKIVSQAFHAGMAVVTFEKTTERGCWVWEDDGEAVLKIGRKFLSSRLLASCGVGRAAATATADDEEAEGPSYPPIYGFGASSGGSFVATLASRMEESLETYAPFLFSAINVQIMNPPESLDWDTPTIFTVMSNDEITRDRVHDRVSKKFQGGPFQMISTSGQKPILPDHFRNVFPDDKQMSPTLSREIHRDLAELGLLDWNAGNLLTGDPRQSADAVRSIWEKYDMATRAEADEKGEDVLPFGVSHQLLRPLRKEEVLDADNVWLIEELNVAWDRHEITAEGFDDVLAFFLEHNVPR
ncbi:hypothetical protein ACHAWF_017917 [Thalassiosira exigua]